MSQTTPVTVPAYATPGRSARRRFNWRPLVFLGACGVLLGGPIYVYLDAALTGGVRDLGNGYKQVDLKALSDFPFDKQDGVTADVPERWRALDGQKIVVDGELAPGTLSATGTGDVFDLVYSVQKCCYSGEPQPQHFVRTVVNQGVDVAYDASAARLRVAGTLKVGVQRDAAGGPVSRVYEIAAERVASVR